MNPLRGVFTTLSRAMSTRKPYLSERELRSLSHQQLLAYTLTHVPISATAPPKSSPQPPVPPESTDTTDTPTPKRKKRRKEFDMSRYGQRLVALHLVYIGWNFHGFSAQADSKNTIEHHIFAALTKTRLIESRATCEYSRSGRTDVGVSALGQVIGIRLRSNVAPPSTGEKELDYIKILNGNLPQGIRVLAWTPVPDGLTPVPKTYDGDPSPIVGYWKAVKEGKLDIDQSNVRRPSQAFSARFDATHRSYKYFFVRGGLDIMAMKTAAKHFEGTHDFRNFCRIDENITNFERQMYTVDIHSANDQTPITPSVADNLRENDMCYIFVQGQAFLWHQVRCMAAVLFDIGMRREDPVLVKRMLDDVKMGTGAFANGKPQYRMASPTPLLLYACAYPASVVAFPQSFEAGQAPGHAKKSNNQVIQRNSFAKADASLAQSYASVATKAAVLESMLAENDRFVSADGHSSTWNDSGKPFKAYRAARSFVLDLKVGNHVPYSQRPCDDSLFVKQQRAARKKEAKPTNH